MKTAFQLLFLFAASALAVAAHAAPSGPSAKMAARLKTNPTSAWLAHYLPDDRYKIAGGVWKYVSTDLDTYYHLPSSPLMMRQPAGIVIGFSSAQQAEEAGYRPDPTLRRVAAQKAQRAQAAASPGVANFRDAGAGGKRVRSARRIVLADGASSLVVPAGWQILRGRVDRGQAGVATLDRFVGPAGQRLMVETINLNAASAPNLDFAKITNINFFKSLQSNGANNLDRTSMVNSQISGQNGLKQLDNYRMFRVNLSGIEGVGGTLKRAMAGQPSPSYVFGRGTKLWVVNDYSTGRQRAMSVIKTVRLR